MDRRCEGSAVRENGILGPFIYKMH
eukprot:COSAG06_NODE_28504_length_573_cov_0.761603_2_plen_24_part_01